MAAVTPSAQRTEFFQQLKRVCVPLSQLALRPKDKPVDSREAIQLIESLISLWTAQANKDAAILDDKLADYVFFPLSHLLRARDRYPIRVTEAVIRLLRDLIQYGWKAKASPQLFQQLLVFLSFTLGGVPGQPKQQGLPEETMIEGFRTLAALIGIAKPPHYTAPASAPPEDRTIPALGHAVSVILDGVTEGVDSSIQVEAVKCLQAVFTTVKDNTVLAQFLPGTVSALTKVLAPPQANQRQRRVLLSCLEALKVVLINVLADMKVRGILIKLEGSKEAERETEGQSTPSNSHVQLTPAWLKATAAQIKIALSAVLKLRSHESEEIQSAIHGLCIGLLDECHASLAECQSILVESALMLEDVDATRSRLQTSLQDLASIYPEFGDSIKSALYSWITGLPRVMQSSDERVKQLAIRSILRGTKLAAAIQMDSSTLDDALGDSLRDSIITLVKGSKQPKMVDDVGDVSVTTELIKSGVELGAYTPVLLDSEGQKNTRREVKALISSIGSSSQQVKLATSMLGYVRDSEGLDRIASFWLAFELLKSTYEQSSELEDLLDFSSLGDSRYQEEAFRELYEFSASVLSAHSDAIEADWRLEAIALEVAAFAASRLKLDFRPELIDVLYPITTFLGSQVPQLRKHAITTLNMIAASCGYESVSDLIVDNADYLVNSVSLRLNTFDISPATTKVLTMVIRLTGPRLIPFLDDVVAAIFAALDNYHGYPLFVESLFSVLSEVVTQGVKSDALLLEDASSRSVDHRKRPPASAGIPGILETLQKNIDRARRSQAEAEAEPQTDLSHPKQPWTDLPPTNEAASLLDKLTNPPNPDDQPASSTAADDGDGQSSEQSQALEKPKEEEKPQTPTYALLTRILSLTQHHLTAPTPALRRSLLDLVATVAPALAPDENAFLPLVHAVWPVVVARLRDPEPFVAVAACKALAGVCKGAGDFVGGRWRAEWYAGTQGGGKGGGVGGGGGVAKVRKGGAGLRAWLREVKERALRERGKGRGRGTVTATGMRKAILGTGAGAGGLALGASVPLGEGILIPARGGSAETEGRLITSSSSSAGSALGRFAQASLVWEAALDLLTAIVGYVRVEDDMFDDVLDLVADVLPQHAELREALETVNADAVWLALYERGLLAVSRVVREPPVGMEGMEFGFARMEWGDRGAGTVQVAV